MKDQDIRLTQKPAQRVSRKKRMAKDFAHTKETMEYYISKCAFDSFQSGSSSIEDKQKLYQIYNNILPEEWFNFVKNPYNTDDKKKRQFPARIRELTIIRPNIELIAGEYLKRPFNKIVNNYASEAYNTYMDEKWRTVKQNLTQHFINYANQAGLNAGQPEQDTPLPGKLAEQFDSNYRDALAIKGQKLISKVEREAEMEEQQFEMFMDWLIAGEAYSYKDEVDGKIVYERVSPLDLDYGKSPDVKYVEDGEFVVRRMEMTIADVVDRFYDSLSKKKIDDLESPYQTQTPTSFYDSLEETTENAHTVEVLHVVWQTQVKYGELYYPDPITGEIQMEEVDEEFSIDMLPEEIRQMASLEWKWENEVWEGYRINGDLFAEMGPRIGKKLPYNGKRFSDRHAKNISVLQLGIPYQILYIIINYRLEWTIAKSKGKVVLLDKHVIPTDPGWDEEKFFYYADAIGWGLLNRDQIGVDKSYNQYQVVDLGLYEHIANLIQILDYIKRDWDEVLGITRQRKGQAMATDTATANERSVFQSSIMSEAIFSGFEKLKERDYQGILELLDQAYVEGLEAVYTSDEMKTELIRLRPGELTMGDLGLFVTSGAKDVDRVKQLQMYAQQSLASGGNLKAIGKLVAAENMSEILRILETASREEAEAAQRAEKSKQETEARMMQIQRENEMFKAEMQKAIVNIEYDRKEILEHIKGQYQNDGDSQEGYTAQPEDSPVDIQKAAIEASKARMDARKKMDETRQKDRELDIKEKEIASKEKIEALKARTALKNKVAGEK